MTTQMQHNNDYQDLHADEFLDGFAFPKKAQAECVELLSDYGFLSVAVLMRHYRIQKQLALGILQLIVDDHMNVYWLKGNWVVINGREEELPDHLCPPKSRVRIRKKPSKWKDVTKP